MKNIAVVFSLLFVLVSCNSESKKLPSKQKEKVSEVSSFEKIPIYDYKALHPLLSKNDGKTYVINFWATWCGPCVKELPYFEKLLAQYKNKNVEVILVSLDFPTQIETKLIPFVKKKNLQAKVVAMVDADQDTWIPKIHKNWSGAIPATLIYNNTDRAFFEKSFEYEELETELNKFLK